VLSQTALHLDADNSQSDVLGWTASSKKYDELVNKLKLVHKSFYYLLLPDELGVVVAYCSHSSLQKTIFELHKRGTSLKLYLFVASLQC
jgi:hypothetical protein